MAWQSAGGTALAAPANPAPNIILIVTDDLGWGDLSCQPQSANLPGARVSTPNIDRLATEGVRCTQAYATCSVCAPSRAALLTGRYQQHFGWYEFKEAMVGIPKHVPVLPETLKPAGYVNACIGKWHVGHPEGSRPLDRGFDRFFGFLGGQHDFYDPRLGDPMVGLSFDFDAYVYDQTTPVAGIDYMTHELTRRSLDFIQERAALQQRFFLYLAYNTPHPPLQATRNKLEPYATARKTGRATSRDIVRAMLESLDDDIGKLTAKLAALGIADNTLIVFTSDNGGHDDSWDGQTRPARTAEQDLVQYNGGLRPRKGFFWEGGIRVPLILRWPAQLKGGQVYTRPVSHLDLFPTFLQAAGIKREGHSLDGVDLTPFLQGLNTGEPHEVLYWGFRPQDGRWAVRRGPWKLIREMEGPWDLKTVVTQLHDLEADPMEKQDLSKVHPEKVQELLKLKADFDTRMQPSLATPEVIRAWEQALQERRAKHPNADALRRDGAPGVGDWPSREILHTMTR